MYYRDLSQAHSDLTSSLIFWKRISFTGDTKLGAVTSTRGARGTTQRELKDKLWNVHAELSSWAARWQAKLIWFAGKFRAMHTGRSSLNYSYTCLGSTSAVATLGKELSSTVDNLIKTSALSPAAVNEANKMLANAMPRWHWNYNSNLLRISEQAQDL